MADLLGAMAMEQEYRELQTDWEAKTAFGYHDKLKVFGFNDTIEYEAAKDIYYLTSTNWTVLEIGASQFISALQSAVSLEQETVFIVIPENLMAWIGSDGYNADYCTANDIPVREVGYGGGTIVTGPEDVAVGLLARRATAGEALAQRFYEKILEFFPTAEFVDNDILIDGYKVFGIGRKQLGNLYLHTYQMTIQSYPEAVANICTKASDKPVKGMAELGKINRNQLIRGIKACLQ